MQTTQDNIHIDLSIEEINTVLEALSNAPYKQVYHLIGKLQQTAQEQLAPPAQGLSKSTG